MSRKAELAALAVVLGLVLATNADLLSTKRALFTRDVARIYLPERHVLREAARDGFPFWNPRYAAGQPLAANPAYEVFYPLHWLIFLPNFLFACAAEVVAHFLIGAAGMFVLLRSLRLRAEAAAFGAVTFALGGLTLSFASLFPCLFAVAWWPWLGFFARRFFDTKRAADFAAASLVLGLILLIGEPSTILQSGALLGAYALYRLRSAKAIAWTAAICLTALLAGAAQVVPALDHARDSRRADALPYDVVTRWSLDPARPLELLGVPIKSADPSGQPWLLSWYEGMLAAALIAAGFIHRVRGWSFAAAVTVIGYILALGRHGPLVIAWIRYPEKWFVPAAFVLIVFAAIAADRLLDDAVFRRTTQIAAAVFAVVNAIAGGVNAGTAAAAALALILFLRGRLQLVLLAVFVIVDLGARVRDVAPRIDAAFYTDRPAIVQRIPPRSRIYNDADWQSAGKSSSVERVHDAMLPELQALWGFDGVLENDITLTNLRPSYDFLSLFHGARFGGRPDLVPMLLRFAGATHVITTEGIVPLPANRKYTVAGALAATTRIGEPHPWPSGIAFVDHPFAPAPARIAGVRERASAIDVDVDSSGRALLVMAITPHKYWRATIDGTPAPLLRANLGFQAIEVPRGRHHVALRYRNPLVVACAIVSLIAIAALATAAALRSRAPRPQPLR